MLCSVWVEILKHVAFMATPQCVIPKQMQTKVLTGLIFVPQERNGNSKSGVVRVPGVDLVFHHDMLGRVLDHAPQRVLHPVVEAVLVLCRRLLALAGFARCV